MLKLMHEVASREGFEPPIYGLEGRCIIRYATARFKPGARGRTRTGTLLNSQQILSLLCLPIPPLGQFGGPTGT